MKKVIIYLLSTIFILYPNTCLANEFYINLGFNDSYELENTKKDPAMAAVLSSILFGSGQIYGGNLYKGLTVMGIGIGLTIGSFGILLPELDKKPPTASNLGKILIYLTLISYYLWNIRDAYYTTLEINENIDKELLIK